MADKIREEGGVVNAGQLVSLIDIPAEAGFGLFENLHGHANAQIFADAIKQAATTHYGHAARAFIKAFQENREYAIKKLRDEITPDKMNELYIIG